MKMPKLITFAAILFAVVYFAGNSNKAFAAGNDGILSDSTKKETPVKAKPVETPVKADTTKSEK